MSETETVRPRGFKSAFDIEVEANQAQIEIMETLKRIERILAIMVAQDKERRAL